MEYLDYDLGFRESGDVAVVTLRGTEANVGLVDQVNFQAYRSGRDYRYVGGHYNRSPIRLGVPHSGHWHIVVDLGGYDGQVDASVEVIHRRAA